MNSDLIIDINMWHGTQSHTPVLFFKPNAEDRALITEGVLVLRG